MNGGLIPKGKGVESDSCKNMFLRADRIDLKTLDIQLEKHLSRVWSRDREVHRPKEEWEIESSNLEIRYSVAHGSFGTVYRGTYKGQDVAGNILPTRLFFYELVETCFMFLVLSHNNVALVTIMLHLIDWIGELLSLCHG